MPQRGSVLLNLLVVFGPIVWSVLVGSSFSAGTGEALGSAPAVTSGAGGRPLADG